jgi:hypothetical protein
LIIKWIQENEIAFSHHLPLIKDSFQENSGPDNKNCVFFVLREAFNNSHQQPIPYALISKVFKQNFIPDMAMVIKQYYLQAHASRFYDLLSSPEAQLWKPVCAEVCTLIGIKETDLNRCLVRILLLPQEEKTKINITLC